MEKYFYSTLLFVFFSGIVNAQAVCDSLISTSQTVTGLSNGEYKVIVTSSNGCEREQSVMVYTDNTLSISAYVLQYNACNTSNAGQATVDAFGGSGYTYHWSNGQNQQTITGLANGTYSVTVTDNTSCSQTASVTVYTDNTLSISAYVLQYNACNTSNSGQATVDAFGGSGYAYHWSNGQNQQTITGLANGTYQVTVTDNTNCSQTASVTVYTDNTLSISAYVLQYNACNTSNAGQATVDAFGGNGYTYHWSTGQNQQTITGLTNGAYLVTVTDNTNCSQTSSVNVYTDNSLSISAYVLQYNACNTTNAGQITVDAFGGNGYTYQWYKITGAAQAVISVNGFVLIASAGSSYQWYLNGQIIQGATGQSYTATVSGNYTVEVTYSNGCSSLSAPSTINIPSGINTALPEEVRIFPNPGAGVFQVMLPASVTLGENDWLKVIDQTGRVVYETGNLSTNNTVDISNCSNGVYVMLLQTGIGRVAYKFMNQK